MVFTPILFKLFNIPCGGLLFRCNSRTDQLFDCTLFGLLSFQPCEDVGICLVVEFEVHSGAVSCITECLLVCPVLPFLFGFLAIPFPASECLRHMEFFAICHVCSSFG